MTCRFQITIKTSEAKHSMRQNLSIDGKLLLEKNTKFFPLFICPTKLSFLGKWFIWNPKNWYYTKSMLTVLSCLCRHQVRGCVVPILQIRVVQSTSPACYIHLSDRLISLVHMFQKQTGHIWKSITYLDQKYTYRIEINVRTWCWKSEALKCIGCVPKPQNQSLTERDVLGGWKVQNKLK